MKIIVARLEAVYLHRITTKCPSRYRKGQDTTFTVVEYDLWLPFPPQNKEAP